MGVKKISPFVDLAVGVDIEINFKFDTSFKFYHGTTDNYFLNSNENFDYAEKQYTFEWLVLRKLA